VPLVSVNEDYAARKVCNGDQWKTFAELASDVNAASGTLTASGTTLGGAWIYVGNLENLVGADRLGVNPWRPT
jgi:hypothetical protein